LVFGNREAVGSFPTVIKASKKKEVAQTFLWGENPQLWWFDQTTIILVHCCYLGGVVF
jgi:hypothetical protein